MKKSKLQRKFVNQMRAMGDVPWSARRFKYPPTFGNAVGANPRTLVGTCKRVVHTSTVRRGKLRRKQEVEVRCGGKVYVLRGSLGKRRLVCVDCQERKRERLRVQRIQRLMQARFGIDTRPQAAADTSKFKRLLRKGR